MALVDLPVLLPYPGLKASSVPTTSAQTIDAAGEYQAAVLAAPKAGNIRKFGWLPGTVSGAGTVELRAETVGSDGLPTGTLWGTNTNLAGIAATTGTWRWDTLTADAAVTRGQLIAFKLLYQSGTSIQARSWNTVPAVYTSIPYRVGNTGTPTASALPLIAAIQYDDGSVAFCGLYPSDIASVFGISVTETGSPDEAGAKIGIPFACSVIGIALNAMSAGRIFDLKLYDSLDNVLASITSIDSDWGGGTTTPGFYLFASPVQLAAGTYRATVLAKSGGSGVTLGRVTVDAAATRSAWPGGADCMLTQRTDAGAWTDTNTALPFMDLLLSQLDDGAVAAGGLLVHPGMTGGLL